MKAFIALSAVIALAAKSSAKCWSEKLGYPCCSSSDAKVRYTDKDGNWGVENNEWCGIPKEDPTACWSEPLGYPCCETTTKVIFSDEEGNWGIEGKDWCGITNTENDENDKNKNDDDDLLRIEPEPIGDINPFSNVDFYINPYYSIDVDEAIAKMSDSSLIAKAEKMKNISTAIWLDSIKTMNERFEQSLKGSQAQQIGNKKVLTVFVLYDLPGRDCHALASNGELLPNDDDLSRYKSEYIDAIDEYLKKYKTQPVVFIIEPDSLSQLINYGENTPACKEAEKYYLDSHAYLIKRFGIYQHVSIYLDIGNAYKLGWDDVREKAANLYAKVISSGAPGKIRGFADNIGDYVPWDDPTLSSGEEVEWNPYPDEKRYLQAVYKDFKSAGIRYVNFLTDTSHNGMGVNLDNDNKFWCKSTPVGVGARPEANPVSDMDHLDAFYWIKPLGKVAKSPVIEGCNLYSKLYSNDQWDQKLFEEGIKNANPSL